MKCLVAVAAAVLVSCAGATPKPMCVTTCGMKISETTSTAWSCAAVQQVEDNATRVFMKVTDPRFADGATCKAVKGWIVRVQTGSPSWIGQKGGKVSGESYCQANLMLVGDRPPSVSSLAHEMAHATQHCDAHGPIDAHTWDDADHVGWTAQGIYAAIEEIKWASP